MDAVQDQVLIEMEAIQARRLAQVLESPLQAQATECADCGDPIDPRRVRAAPGCSRCVGCQGRMERQASHRR